MKTAKQIMYDCKSSNSSGLECEDVEIAMKIYAKQVAKQALLDASENAIIYCSDMEPEGVDKHSILKTLIQLP